MSEESQYKIIINLKESSNAKEFETGNRIHPIEFERAKLLIDRGIERAIEYKDQDKKCKDQDNKNNSRQRNNDTISILGSRGSGKTSFLLSLLKYYKNKEGDKDNAEVLEIIDPTLIEEKGHVFLTILSLIEEAVCKKIKLNDCSPNDANYCLKKEWKDKLRKLADGLPSIDGIGLSMNDTNWQDAEFIMDRGLKSVKAAKDLEANFNDLVACALKTLGKEAFIITLDDIDVDFRKGWPVLETIRKYLTSPQIIVLLSGDLKLYSKAIRKQQWKNFGKALLKNEAEALDKMNGYNDLVTEMESQYLQKVIMPENRIHLASLLEKVTTYKSLVEIEILLKGPKVDKTQDKKIDLLSFYKDILVEFGIKNKYQAEAYYSFLLSLPIRTQFQFLHEAQKLVSKDVSNIEANDSTKEQKNDTANVIDAFLSDLYEKEVDIDLAKYMPKMLNVIILKLLIKEQVLSEAYQLQPTTSDTSLNSSLMALSFLFSQKVKNNPHLIFDYFIKIGYVRNLLPNVGFVEGDNKNITSLMKPSIDGLCNYSGLFQDKVLRDVVGNMTAYIESTLNSQEKQIGNIYLYGIAGKANTSKEESKGRIDFELKGKSSIQQMLAFIPLSISQNLIKNTTIISFSTYSLLASIGELIRKMELDDMGRGLSELSQLRTYPMISFTQGVTNTSDMGELEGIEITKDSESSKLDIYLKNWYSKYPKKKYSPHVLGKILTRVHYTFNSIEKGQDIDTDLAEAIHRRIVALMNAILIEDVRENMTDCQSLNISNAVTADNNFIDNLKVAVENKEQNDFNFSRWMLSCPLFLLYLNPKLLADINLKKFIHPIINRNEISDSDWEYANFDKRKIEEIELEDLNIQVLKKKSVYITLAEVFVQKKKGSIESTLPKFSGAKGKALKTIEILKPIITYQKFMDLSLNDVVIACEKSFAPKIAPASISSLRGYIRDNKITW